MAKNQDNWEKITNFTKDYEPEPNLANDVILKLNQKESTVKFKKVSSALILGALCFVIALAIFLCIFLIRNDRNNSNKLYLNDNDLNISKVEDINKFVADNQLNILYNNSPNCNTQSVIINANQRLAYIEQSYFVLSEEGFEDVNLKIVFVEAVYDFSENFTLLENLIEISDIDIKYDSFLSDSGYIVYAKFSVNNVEYYLNINNVVNVENTLSGILFSLNNK